MSRYLDLQLQVTDNDIDFEHLGHMTSQCDIFETNFSVEQKLTHTTVVDIRALCVQFQRTLGVMFFNVILFLQRLHMSTMSSPCTVMVISMLAYQCFFTFPSVFLLPSSTCSSSSSSSTNIVSLDQTDT